MTIRKSFSGKGCLAAIGGYLLINGIGVASHMIVTWVGHEIGDLIKLTPMGLFWLQFFAFAVAWLLYAEYET